MCGSMMIACVCMCGAEVCGGLGDVWWCECQCGCEGGWEYGYVCVFADGGVECVLDVCLVTVVWCVSA